MNAEANLSPSIVRRLAIAAAVAALALFVGCGDDEDDPDDGGADTEVVLNEEAAVDAGEADAEATQEPTGPEVLDQLSPLVRADENQGVPAIRGSAGLSIPEWMHSVNGDITTYWQQQFNGSGYRYRLPGEVLFDRTVRTDCGRGRASFGPFYCSNDEVIYLPVKFFEMANRRFGDAAVALVIAHENGHHVQQRLGLFNSGLLTAQTELQADCLAGVWANTVLERGLIEEGDIGEILGLTEISGDIEGTPIDTPGAHGSSALRVNYFNEGYSGGDPGACPVPRKRDIR